MSAVFFDPAKDKLLAVWTLKTLGWSWNRIAHLFHIPRDTVRYWYKQACELPEDDFSHIWPNRWRHSKIIYRGSSCDLEKALSFTGKGQVKKAGDGIYKQFGPGVGELILREELREVKGYAKKQKKNALKKAKKCG